MSAAAIVTEIALTLGATAFTVATLALVTGVGRGRGLRRRAAVERELS